MVAALIWWFISLQRLNMQMMKLRLIQLHPENADFSTLYHLVQKEAQRRTVQYISEGSTFLLLILVGAVFVYRVVRRQFRVQQQQQNFMMAVTHELKTPIAVAKLNLETLQRYSLDEEKRNRMLVSALQEINRLNNLSSNILISSQLEGGNYIPAKEEFPFSDTIIQMAEEYRHRFPDRKWEASVQPDIGIRGDSVLLRVLISNLVENSVKYSQKNSLIRLELERERDGVLFRILDEGYGIPTEEKKKIFERFYRVGNESTRVAPGTGLGLYLCNKIAADHGARITVTDNSPAGSIFAVKFS
jgi:K+-sensing histidine kinase KdpD